jgi:hypothetical protein
MIELFRYIEQEFVLPAATDSIDVENESEFQTSLRAAAQENSPSGQIRELAGSFLSGAFPSPVATPFALASQDAAFRTGLEALAAPDDSAIGQLVSKVFGQNARQVIDSDAFIADKELLDDSLVAVKLVTGFDKVNAADLVSMRQTAAFLEDFAAGNLAKLTPKDVKRLLFRPVRIPQAFVAALTADASARRARAAPTRDIAGGADARRIAALQAEQTVLESVYDYVMALQPEQLELAAVNAPVTLPMRPAGEPGRGDGQADSGLSQANREYLRISESALESLDGEKRQMLAKLGVDPARSPVGRVLDTVKRKWIETSRQLLPYRVPQPAKVYRVGAHVFAIQAQTLAADMAGDPPPAPDFSHAITRPVGVGNLQVVRQELIGYETGDISHIENVLEGELFRRSTRREETNELTITQETDRTQTEERDQQSTDRNELATETQKESGQQSTRTRLTTPNGYSSTFR